MKKLIDLLSPYIWALPFILFILGYMGASLFIPKRSITAPHLIGKQTHEATQICSPLRIHLYITEEKIEDDLPIGTIIYQKPTPGSTLKAGQPIFIVTTKHNDSPLLPDFIHQSKTHIMQWCKEQGVRCKIYAISSNLPEETCIGQYPQAGTRLIDKKIHVYIAKHQSNQYVFPTCIGLNAAQVHAFIQKSGNQARYYEKNQEISQESLEQYTIVQQKPTPGTFVKLDKPMHIQYEVQRIKPQNSFWPFGNQ
jgi:beta-lactam-binding protein with PASTA domain